MARQRGASTPRRKAAADKRAAALELRIGGVSYEQIAMAVGYNDRSAAHKAVMDALKDIPREKAEELRNLESERFDAMLTPMWPRALRGDTSAIDTVLKIQAARAKMFGINIEAEGTPPMVIQKAYISIPIEHFLSSGPDTIDSTAVEVKERSAE